MGKINAFSFKRWIDEHRHLLKPPVNNAIVFEDSEFLIMVVGGPNQRKDYHVDPAEEFFYQLEGEMVLKIVEDGEFRDVRIGEGDILLLPPGVPHSPQRFADTVGLVVERRRRPDEHDGLRWYCEQCHEVLYEETFFLTDITTQLPPVFERFFGSESNRRCASCGWLMPAPSKGV
ncbi:MAG: 3-hydroxyanthranilate 3,4-dioxygenase [Deltaproteobacteria bacterium]|nr:3-hydroxyanthranilate 3,4-dioxygenase [Deltaproteobacteria bacterium]